MKKYTKHLLLFVGLLSVGILMYRLYLEYYPDIQLYLDPKTSRELLLKSVRSHGVRTGVILVVLTSLMCAIPGLPTSIVGVLVGVCYGPLVGSLMNLLGNAGGNLLSIFLLGKLPILTKSTQENRWVKTISQMKHPKLGVTLGYMIPIIPAIVVNYTVDQLKLSLKQSGWIVLLGVAPSSILYAFGGDALFKGNHKTALLLVASVVLLVLLVGIIVKDRRRGKKRLAS